MNLPNPKIKRCRCGVRLFRAQGESEAEYEARVKCPRCAQDRPSAIAGGNSVVVEGRPKLNALEGK
jgi:hypothetical protein